MIHPYAPDAVVEYVPKEEDPRDYRVSFRKIKDEIGDIMIYLANLCDKLNIDPVVAAHDKVEKNRSKYPADKAKGSAKKYTELDWWLFMPRQNQSLSPMSVIIG